MRVGLDPMRLVSRREGERETLWAQQEGSSLWVMEGTLTRDQSAGTVTWDFQNPEPRKVQVHCLGRLVWSFVMAAEQTKIMSYERRRLLYFSEEFGLSAAMICGIWTRRLKAMDPGHPHLCLARLHHCWKCPRSNPHRGFCGDNMTSFGMSLMCKCHLTFPPIEKTKCYFNSRLMNGSQDSVNLLMSIRENSYLFALGTHCRFASY